MISDFNFWINLREISTLYEPLCDLISYSEAVDSRLSEAFEKFIIFGKNLAQTTDKPFRNDMYEGFLYHFHLH